LKTKLDKLFPSGKHVAMPVAATVPAPAAGGPRTLLVDKPGAAQTEMRAYQPGPRRVTPDYFPLVVLNQILGGSFSSRLNTVLREQKGYTYGARSSFAFRREGGPFDAGAPVKTAVTGPALRDLREELQRITDSDVSDVELAWAKKNLVRSLAREFETPPQVAMALATQRLYDLPNDYYATYAKRIEAVTVADLHRVASTLHPSEMTLVFVGDEKVIGPEIKKVLPSYEEIAAPK
jgi:predicted Zn-dependent peptidase